MNTSVLGKWGEKVALEFLLAKGCSLVSKGIRSRFGEVDLVVRDNECIVFVEVKTRKSSNFAYAREYVGKSKQRKIIATANYWLARHSSKLQPRFDVIEVYAPDGEQTKNPEIVHIENAFGV